MIPGLNVQHRDEWLRALVSWAHLLSTKSGGEIGCPQKDKGEKKKKLHKVFIIMSLKKCDHTCEIFHEAILIENVKIMQTKFS